MYTKLSNVVYISRYLSMINNWTFDQLINLLCDNFMCVSESRHSVVSPVEDTRKIINC